MALTPSPTHPERCATKFRARKRQQILKIFHLVPDREKNVVRKCPQNRVSIAKCEIGSIHKSEAPSIHKSDHKSEDPSIAKSEAPYIHIHTRINRYPHTLVRGNNNICIRIMIPIIVVHIIMISNSSLAFPI